MSGVLSDTFSLDLPRQEKLLYLATLPFCSKQCFGFFSYLLKVEEEV